MRPRSWSAFDGARRTRNLLRPAAVQDSPACFCSTRTRSNSGIPAVFRLAMTRPGVFSPVSHSVQAASNFSGSGGGGPALMSIQEGYRHAVSWRLSMRGNSKHQRTTQTAGPEGPAVANNPYGLITSFRPCHPYRPWRQRQQQRRHRRRAYRRRVLQW